MSIKMSQMTIQYETKNTKLINSPLSTQNQKFETRIKREKRYSGIFEPCKKDGKIIAHRASVEDLISGNLSSDDIKTVLQSTKRKNASYTDISITSTMRDINFNTAEHVATKDYEFQTHLHVYHKRKCPMKNDQKHQRYSLEDPMEGTYSNLYKELSEISNKPMVRENYLNDDKEKYKNVSTNVTYHKKHADFEDEIHYETVKNYKSRKSTNKNSTKENMKKNQIVVTNSTSKINIKQSKFEFWRKENVTRKSLSKKDYSEVPPKTEENINTMCNLTLSMEHLSNEELCQIKKSNEEQKKSETMSSKELTFENNWYECPEILKYYTDKSVNKFNNLETIFEQPKGENIMGKRKLKRYLNLEEVFNTKKQFKRRIKARKLNPRFRMEPLHLDELKIDMLKEKDFFG
ncbi:uncharacterized protein LOC130899061 [Diorhabda carinulata]|uniref:uncharacterized protein LOC130899061 n=1 Tax=Diorhabda carinulata TaxID=1163345 RepID=UPI0025A2BF8E|nr:uncharacterized protein LOC130899061 [Diorhabda carinulata]